LRLKDRSGIETIVDATNGRGAYMREIVRAIAVIACLGMSLGLLRSAERGTRGETRFHGLAAKIKRAVARDESLYRSSRDIDVIVEHGVVILKGMVRSDEESQAIQGKAESLVIQNTPAQLVHARELEIDNQLQVARSR
jgi:hypothetical protein